MRILNSTSLLEYRANVAKNQLIEAHDCPVVQLYGVVGSLNMAVITFIKLSKNFLYDDKGNKYKFSGRIESFTTMNSNGLAVFTSESEAWKFFKDMTIKKREETENLFKIEMSIVESATALIQEKMEFFPEYFI